MAIASFLFAALACCVGPGAYAAEAPAVQDVTAYANRRDLLGHYRSPLIREMLDTFGIKPSGNLFLLLRPADNMAHLIRVKGSHWRH